MSNEVKKARYKLIGFILMILAVVTGIVVFLLINKKETYVKMEAWQEKTEAIVCSARSLDGAFFEPENVNMVENKIKIIFSNDKMDKLSYSYNGVYRSNDLAVSDEAVLHAQYNKYMGENGRALEDLSPAYSVVGSKVQITLYADTVNRIDAVTAGFFFVDKSEVSKFVKRSVSETEKYYENKGFSCENI